MEHGRVNDHNWLVTFAVHDPLHTVRTSGPNVSVDNTGDTLAITVTEPFLSHRLLHITHGNVELETFPGNIHPTFCRLVDQHAYLSNNASLLMRSGEVLKLNALVFAQQVAASASPVDDLFCDIPKLDAASVYSITPSGLAYQRSAIRHMERATVDDAFDIIESQFAEYLRGGSPIVVPLSAGYDSRLNLGMVARWARQHDNIVYAAHEFKNSKEHDIAKAVADVHSLPFSSVTRNRFASRYHDVLLDPDFLNYNNGVVRDLLVRWSMHLRWVRADVPDGTIIGFGAEAHKGKYYYKMHDLRRDPAEYLGVKMKQLESGYFRLPIDQLQSMHSDFFDTLYERSEYLESKHSQIDFIHYHSYSAKHAGARSPYFNHFLGVPFPFLSNTFLSVVFSLPMRHKVNGQLSVGFMERVCPELLRIPFVSGNAPSYERPWRAFAKKALRKATPAMYPRRPVVQPQFAFDGRLREAFDGAQSEVTKRLEEYVLMGGDGALKIRWNFAILMYLYLRNLEDTLSVTFELQR